MNPQDAWNAAFHQLEMQLDRASFETWLRGAVLLGVETSEDGDLIRGIRGRCTQHLRPRYASASALPQRPPRSRRRVRHRSSSFASKSTNPPPEIAAGKRRRHAAVSPAGAARPGAAGSPPLHEQVARPQRPELPESELNPRFTFDRFVAGNENATIFAAAQAVAERPTPTIPFLFTAASVWAKRICCKRLPTPAKRATCA